MKTIRTAAFVILFLINGYAAGQILNVPEVIQEQDQWCWAGVSACVLQYYGTVVSQCTIAEYTRTQATWNDFGSVNCCVNPSLGCNYWNYGWGFPGSLQDILQHWGVDNYGYYPYLTIQQAESELSAGRPFIMRWGWTTGGGHFLVGHGLQGSMLYYMDPWFGEGYTISDYNWVISAPDHEWTHTNVITTEFHDYPMAPENFAAYSDYQSPTAITLTWNDPVITRGGQYLSQFTIRISRDSTVVAEVNANVLHYTDTGLVKHRHYTYTAQAVANAVAGIEASASWYAGGSPIPDRPTNFTVADGEDGARLTWKNPSCQRDGTPLDDISAIRVYRDGLFAGELQQAFCDTGQCRSFTDTAAGYHWYRLTTGDNEGPQNESTPTDSLLAFGRMGETYDDCLENGVGLLYRTGSWDTTQAIAHDGVASLTDSPHGNSPGSSTSYVLLPPVILKDDAILRFQHIAIVNAASSLASVDISSNNRRTFKQIGTFNWDSDPSWSDGTADPGDWQGAAFDLSSYFGDTITIRLRMITTLGQTGDGWYIDSITIAPSSEVASYDCPVMAGWNLLSLPARTTDQARATIYPSSVSSAFVYAGTYVKCESLSPGVGFWVKFDSSETIPFTGYARMHDSLQLVSGWNLIGPPSVSIPVTSISTKPAGILSSPFFGFDGQYQSASSLEPGMGYWVRTSRTGALILRPPSPGALEQTAIRPDDARNPAGGNRLVFSDRTGRTRTLEFGNAIWGALPLSMYDLPPVPPDDAFDIRFASQRSRAVVGSGDCAIALQGITYPLIIQFHVRNGGNGIWSLVGDFPGVGLRSGESLLLERAPGSLALRYVPGDDAPMPENYALDQNFPNPFNPNTSLRYALPVESHVRLRIYNVIGQEVATLFDDVSAAGYHTMDWNSSAVPSGVYICRMEAVSTRDPTRIFTSVQKMVLAR